MFTMLLILGFDRNFIPLEVYLLAAWLRYFNSCANPIVYIFSAPGYKKAFKAMFYSDQNPPRDGTNSSVYFSSNQNIRTTEDKWPVGKLWNAYPVMQISKKWQDVMR